MMKAYFLLFALIIGIIVPSGCGQFATEEEKVHEVTDSFAAKYFTWHFPDAIPYADEDAQQWLRFVSSNVHDADLKLISNTSKVPEYSIADISVTGDTAIVTLELSDVILMDTLGKSAHLYESASRTLTLIKTEDKWKIHSVK